MSAPLPPTRPCAPPRTSCAGRLPAVINTLLAQDAFELTRLKAESRLVSDQREALARAIEKSSSPSALAHSAYALGMRPSDSPIFLNLDAQTLETGVKLNG